MAIREIDQKICFGCSVCVTICPMDVLRMKSGRAEIVYNEDCMTCYLCEVSCPAKAIYISPERSRYIPLPY